MDTRPIGFLKTRPELVVPPVPPVPTATAIGQAPETLFRLGVLIDCAGRTLVELELALKRATGCYWTEVPLPKDWSGDPEGVVAYQIVTARPAAVVVAVLDVVAVGLIGWQLNEKALSDIAEVPEGWSDVLLLRRMALAADLVLSLESRVEDSVKMRQKRSKALQALALVVTETGL